MGAAGGWAKLFALMGEYGMGKTVTCQRLDEELRRLRGEGRDAPLPIYFDLRNVTGLDRRVPTLAETIRECVERGGVSRGAPDEYSLETIYDLVESQAALIIFDGLDEVLVKLRENDGQIFTRDLLRFLYDAKARRAGKNLNSPLPKILISCRSQFFRTLRDQQNDFTGQERGEYRSEAFAAMALLPLNEEQVTDYLRGALPGTDPQRLFDTLRAVHNLEELSRRPYTLKLVADFLPQIEEDRISGIPVYGVSLYRRIAERWLERDAGKHHIRPEHKMSLAAHLAAHLWQYGSGLLPAGDVERWFHAWLDSEPSLGRRYAGLHPDQLEEDLRTATFLARQDDGAKSSFRFAHTSLLEFFLAEYLFQAIRDNLPERWRLKRPSDETLDLLGQMLAESGDPSLPAALLKWAKTYRPQVSELLVAFSLSAHRKGWPAPSMQGWDLRGARLQGMTFTGRNDGWLNLSGTDFSGAVMRECLLARVRVDNCRFHGSWLFRARFLNCAGSRASFRGADLTAAVFRNCGGKAAGGWSESDFCASSVHRCQWLVPGVEGKRAYQGCHFPENIPLGAAFPPRHPLLEAKRLAVLTGHPGRVGALAISPDGARLFSGGDDGAVKTWDTASGDCLSTLTGHEGAVTCLAISPDGARLFSAGDDGAVKIWDAASNDCFATLTEHEGAVTCLAVSPDGGRLFSGGDDSAVKIWDASSGHFLAALTGHEGTVTCLAVSPDGARLFSAGDDGAVKIWDAATREPFAAFAEHNGIVTCLAVSPDGERLFSSGDESTVKIWDAVTGDPLGTLAGYEGWVCSIAVSPDGTKLFTGSDDGAVEMRDAANGDRLATLTGHEGRVRDLVVSADGGRFFSAGNDNEAIKIWDAESGDCLATIARHEAWVMSLAVSPDGARLFSVGLNSAIKTWDASDGECLALSTGDPESAWSAAISPDGERLFSAGFDGTVKIWDAKSGDYLAKPKGHSGWVRSLAASPDGGKLFSAGHDGSVKIWDAAGGGCLGTLTGHDGWIWGLATSPDGARLFSAGSDRTVKVWLWHGESDDCLATLVGHRDRVMSLAVSPDGSRLFSGGGDGVVKIWDAADGECLATLTGHDGWVMDLTTSPKGDVLFSGGYDGTIRRWDTKTLEQIMPVIHSGLRDWALVDYKTNRVVRCGPEAWRNLGWLAPDADGRITRYPVEIEGPLPVKEC